MFLGSGYAFATILGRQQDCTEAFKDRRKELWRYDLTCELTLKLSKRLFGCLSLHAYGPNSTSASLLPDAC
jgi:hypothetical protein